MINLGIHDYRILFYFIFDLTNIAILDVPRKFDLTNISILDVLYKFYRDYGYFIQSSQLECDVCQLNDFSVFFDLC